MKVSVKLNTTPTDLPSGKTPGLFQVTMVSPVAGTPDVVQTAADASTPIDFDMTGLIPGTYNFVGIRLDSDGKDLGAPQTGFIDLPVPPPVTFEAVASLALSLS